MSTICEWNANTYKKFNHLDKWTTYFNSIEWQCNSEVGVNCNQKPSPPQEGSRGNGNFWKIPNILNTGTYPVLTSYMTMA